MSKDLYKKLLNIPEQFRPPTHYQLLGVENFEPDTNVIDRASKDRTRELRKRELDPRYGEEVQRLLTEIAQARVTLLSPERRAKYDRELRERLGEPQTLPTEESLREELRRALGEQPSPPSAEAPSPADNVDQTTEESRPKDVPAPPVPKSFMHRPLADSLRVPSVSEGVAVPRRWRRSQTPLIIGSVAAALVLTVVVFAIINSGSHKVDTSGSKPGGTIISGLPKGDVDSRPANTQKKTKTSSPSAQSSKATRTTQDTGTQQASAKPKQETRKMTLEQRRRNADRSYKAAKVLFGIEAYDAAVLKLQEFTERFPDSEHKDEVKTMLREAEVVLDSQRKYEEAAEKLYSEGKTALESGAYQEAIEKLSGITKDHPNSAVSSQAEDLLKKARTKHAEKLYNKGEAACSEKRYRDAIDPFEQLIERYSKSEWSAEWCAKAKSRLETVNKTLIERIGSDAWVLYGEYKKLNQAGWVSDSNRKLEEIVRHAEGWRSAKVSIGRRSGIRLSKGKMSLKFVEDKGVEGKAKNYLSEQAKKQKADKVLAEGMWLTPDQAKERGMTELGGQWFTSMGLLKQQVMMARINAKRFFAVRRHDFFDRQLREFHKNFWDLLSQLLPPDKDRRQPLDIKDVGVVQALDDFEYNKVESFQPGSDKENTWVAAKATVVVSYNLKVPVYRLGRAAPLSSPRYVKKSTQKIIATKPYICLLIQEGKAIRRFLDSKKGAGELVFHKGMYGIPRNPGIQSTSRLYQQSIFFENGRYGFVIAVIYEPEFNQVFPELKLHMSEPGK